MRAYQNEGLLDLQAVTCSESWRGRSLKFLTAGAYL